MPALCAERGYPACNGTCLQRGILMRYPTYFAHAGDEVRPQSDLVFLSYRRNIPTGPARVIR